MYLKNFRNNIKSMVIKLTEIHEGKKYPIGIEGAKEHIIGVRQTYPDLHLTIDNQIAEGEWVATCIKARGTHKGVCLNIKPTGKILTYTGVNVNRVINGLLVTRQVIAIFIIGIGALDEVFLGELHEIGQINLAGFVEVFR